MQRHGSGQVLNNGANALAKQQQGEYQPWESSHPLVDIFEMQVMHKGKTP